MASSPPISENNFNPQLTTSNQICSNPVFDTKMTLRDAERFLRSTNSDTPISEFQMQLTKVSVCHEETHV